MAKQKIPVATIVWEEWADVSSLSAFLHSDDFCDHCLVPLSNCHGLVECKQCKPSAESSKHKVTRFCSQECLRLGTENFHGFYCKAPKTVHEQIESLKVECREMGQTMPLLVLRYLTILLKEELAGRGTASGVGPFTHYDHLRPQFRSASNEQDRSEAAMLRRIVSSVNENVAEFLTDDIYVTMKGTLATNVIGTHPNPILPTQLTPMQTRQVNSTASILSLFHMAAHLQHSCDPNVALIPGIQPSPVVTKSSMEIDNEEISERKAMSLKVTALRGISPGEVLTMSYLPFEDKTTRAERRLHLKRVFSFDCKCARCEREA